MGKEEKVMKCRWIVLFFTVLLLAKITVVSAEGVNIFASQHIGSQIARTISDNIAKNLADRILLPQLKIRNESGEVKDFSISVDSRFFTLLHDDNTVRIWDAKQGVQRPTIRPDRENVSKVVSISSLNITLLGNEKGGIDVYDVYTGKRVKQLNLIREKIVFLSVSKDESLLAVAYENGNVVILDLNELSIKTTIKTPYDDDLKFVKIESNGMTVVVAGNDGFVDRWSIDKGEKIAALPKQSDDIVGLWVSDIYGGVASFDEDNVLQLIDIKNANELKREIDKDLLTVVFSKGLERLAIAIEEGGIQIFDANTLQRLNEVKSDKAFFYLQFINKGKQLIAADKKGVLHLFDVSTANELLKLISTKTGWTIVDNKGRFDSSEKGMKNVSWETEEKELPIDHFSGSYYEPGLLASHLDDQNFINENLKAVQQGIKLPPDVVIVIPDDNRTAAKPITIRVEAQGLGGGVDEINFYHNGKVVVPTAVINRRQESNDKLIKKTVDYQLLPTVGKNTFKVIATNDMGIEGHSDELAVDFEGKKQKSTLHVLTVGINKYRDSRLNLDYSVADATEISNIFRKSQLAVYDEVVHHDLRDNEATKKGIFKQLNEINNYSQNDVMVLYLAGHGLAVNGEWYYLPHEAMLQDNQDYYTQVGISAKEIQKILTNSKVQHVMVMVDACYSGAGLQAFRKLQDTQRHFSRGLSKSVGVVVLAATRRDQEAAELSDLGHGLFTYVVSEGMGGKADLKPQNLKISAHEVSDFSTETIPSFSKKYLGAAQEPTSFTMGSDFVLLRKE